MIFMVQFSILYGNIITIRELIIALLLLSLLLNRLYLKKQEIITYKIFKRNRFVSFNPKNQ